MKLYSLLLCASAACWFGMQDINAQITERPRPSNGITWLKAPGL